MRVWLVTSEEKFEIEYLLANIEKLARERLVLVHNLKQNEVQAMLLALCNKRDKTEGKFLQVYLFEGISLAPGAKEVSLVQMGLSRSERTITGDC